MTSLVKKKWARAADGVLDGTYLAESLFVNAPLFWGDSSEEASEFQVDFYHSDEVVIAIALAFVFALASVVARCTKVKAGTPEWHAMIVVYWPYIRDALRGLKNGHHAVVNVASLTQSLAHCAVAAIASPTAIVFGGLLAVNFIYYRRMNKQRSDGKQANKDLFSQIKAERLTTDTNQAPIFRHSNQKRQFNYVSAGFDGLLDGLYLYGCLMVLLTLGVSGLTGGAPLILALVLISAYGFTSFVSRLHDEYEKQNQLEASALACEIALLKNEEKKLEAELGGLQEASPNPLLTAEQCELTPERSLRAAITEKQIAIQAKQDAYDALTLPPDDSNKTELGKCVFYMGRGCLSGVKNAKAAIFSVALMCNNAIATAVFAVVSVVACVLYGAYLTAVAVVERSESKKAAHNNVSLFKSARHNALLEGDSFGSYAGAGHLSAAQRQNQEEKRAELDLNEFVARTD